MTALLPLVASLALASPGATVDAAAPPPSEARPARWSVSGGYRNEYLGFASGGELRLDRALYAPAPWLRTYAGLQLEYVKAAQLIGSGAPLDMGGEQHRWPDASTISARADDDVRALGVGGVTLALGRFELDLSLLAGPELLRQSETLHLTDLGIEETYSNNQVVFTASTTARVQVRVFDELRLYLGPTWNFTDLGKVAISAGAAYRF